MSKNTPQYVYHYTSMSTLLHLIDFENATNNNQTEPMLEFLATDINALNDRTEYRAINQLISKIKQSEMDLKFMNEISGFPFVLSFSTQSNSLPLWRSYANFGHGICLKFDAKEIRNEIIIPEQQKPYKWIRTGYCFYKETNEFKLLKNEIKDLYNDPLQDKFWNNMDKFNEFILESAFLKDKAYSYEDEWRVVILDKNYLFRPQSDSFATCARVQIPLKCLKGICLGPCTIDYDKLTIEKWRRMYERTLSTDISITYSHLPYRN